MQSNVSELCIGEAGSRRSGLGAVVVVRARGKGLSVILFGYPFSWTLRERRSDLTVPDGSVTNTRDDSYADITPGRCV